MANIAVTTQYPTANGITPAYQAPNTTDTYQVQNDGKTVLHVKKTGANPCNVTIQTPGTVDGQAIADRVVTVPAASGDKIIGPLSREAYSDTLNITFSEITGLTFAAIALP